MRFSLHKTLLPGHTGSKQERQVFPMKCFVNENCIGCGLCTSLCPEVFSMEYSPTAKAMEGEIPPELEDSARQARDSCPVAAIDCD